MGPRMLRGSILAAFFLSGLTGLLYENLWIRMLTLVVGGTTAALTTALVAFMGGLGLGGILFGGVADRHPSPLRVYGFIELAIGGYGLLTPWLFSLVPAIYPFLHALDPAHGVLFGVSRFALSLTLLGLPSTLMGGTLPLIVKSLTSGRGGLEATVARAYAVNTFGGALGAFAAGFLVLPMLGVTHTLWVTGGVNILLGALFVSLSARMVPVSSGVKHG